MTAQQTKTTKNAPDVQKVFAAIAQIVSGRGDANVKLKAIKPAPLMQKAG